MAFALMALLPLLPLLTPIRSFDLAQNTHHILILLKFIGALL